MTSPSPHRDEFPDEEALASGLDPALRRRRGVYFTPGSLVSAVLDRVAPRVPPSGRLAIIDPACGAGAFLVQAAQRFPRAELLGLELSAESAARCRARVPRATVLEGDALRGDFPLLLSRIPQGAFELWVGNPPYNGTSRVLGDKGAYAALRALLPRGRALPTGTSLRDDYAFFLLLAADRLRRVPGVLAFVTSASLLDAYLYAPLREALLGGLELSEVMELGPGVFANTRVRTCVTFWSTRRSGGPARYCSRRAERGFSEGQLSVPTEFRPCGPDWLLRPSDARAEALDRAWRASGEPLSTLIPLSFPGLKTRFDELLVDADPERLLRRVDAFLAARPEGLADFARAHGIPPRRWEKLAALKASLPGALRSAEPERIRPFFRYAGARHRGAIPASARAHCYLDRRLIPRGDHRLRGDYDPHACREKLVFNVRELPLSAALLLEPGCVHDHRHARFAPLWVPERLREQGLGEARRGRPLGPMVPNLSAQGRRWADWAGGPLEVLRGVMAFINSREVQEIWAPAFGASRELPVPLPAALTAGRPRGR